MAYRFTNTEKWQDVWFSNLTQLQMLLFLYLCDNCDIAGFIEVNYKRWSSDLGSSVSTIEGACKGLARGLVFSENNECIFIRNFLKHQKNIPLNENNKAHIGILKRFELYSKKFDIQDIDEFIQRGYEGACKGLSSPSGIGIGNGIGNGKELKDGKLKIEIPSEVEFLSYAKSNKPNVDIQAVKLKYKSWIENDWRDGKNNKIVKWKSKLLNTLQYLPETTVKQIYR